MSAKFIIIYNILNNNATISAEAKTLLMRKFNIGGSKEDRQFDRVVRLGKNDNPELIVDLMKLSPKKRAAAVKKLPQTLFADVK